MPFSHTRPPLERVSLFVQAARELATETGSSAFTVQQVVARSEQSLKSFYRYFDGKDGLLLALIEEDCALGAGILAPRLERQSDVTDRLKAWVLGVFDMMAVGEEGYVSVLAREHRRLTEVHPIETEIALRPLLQPLVDDLTLAMRQGFVRTGDPVRDAHSIFNLVLVYLHDLLVAGRPKAQVAETAEYVWTFCWGGLQTEESP